MLSQDRADFAKLCFGKLRQIILERHLGLHLGPRGAQQLPSIGDDGAFFRPCCRIHFQSTAR